MKFKKVLVAVLALCMSIILFVACDSNNQAQNGTSNNNQKQNKGECTHVWESATCEKAKTCSLCSETEGTPLEHSYSVATCEKAKTCSICGNTVGSPLGHSYSDATCTKAKTCSVCGNTAGSPLGHSYEKGICKVCNEISSSAKSEQLAICEEIIADTETLEKYCLIQALAYQNAWYFSIYKADDYYSYDKILSDFSKYIAIDSSYVNDAIIDYLESLGKETSQLYGIAVLRTNSGALAVTERSMELYVDMPNQCSGLITKIVNNLEKINGKVVGDDYVKAIVNYCNVILNYYDFAKTPSGSYNSYTSEASTFKTLCSNAKNALKLAKP